MTDKMKFNVDWLSIRLDGLNSPDEFINLFLEEFPSCSVAVRECGGVNFYKYAYNVPECGHSSIIFGYNVNEFGEFLNEESFPTPHGLMITISGDGCRYLNSLRENGMCVFCSLCAKFPYNATRIDMACDFLDENNSIVPMIQLWASEFYSDSEEKSYGLSCNMKQENLVNINCVYDKVLRQLTNNITVGQRDSRKGVMQLYNKRVEVENGRLSDIASQTFEQYGVTDYWWRLEYRCKSFSNAVFENLLQSGVHAAFLCAMNEFGRFYIPKYDNCSMNPTSFEWQAFYDEIEEFIKSNDEEFIHLVEFVSQPYISADVKRTMKYSSRMSVFLYKFSVLGALNPSWFQDVLREGRLRYLANNRNLSFRNELRSDYGFDAFPEVSITLPELEQISMEV